MNARRFIEFPTLDPEAIRDELAHMVPVSVWMEWNGNRRDFCEVERGSPVILREITEAEHEERLEVARAGKDAYIAVLAAHKAEKRQAKQQKRRDKLQRSLSADRFWINYGARSFKQWWRVPIAQSPDRKPPSFYYDKGMTPQDALIELLLKIQPSESGKYAEAQAVIAILRQSGSLGVTNAN